MAENVKKLFEVVQRGDVLKLEEYLNADRSSVNKFNEHQQTLLTQAASQGSLEMVQVLLGNGADANTVAVGLPSALMLAVEKQNKEMVKLLLRHRADSSNSSKVGGGTVLSQALRMNWKEMADVLLRHGVDINARDKMGLTALMYAAMEGTYGEVKYLLDKGANMDVSCNTLSTMGKKTALLGAAMHDRTNVVKLLLDRGSTILPRHYKEFLTYSRVVDSPAAQECSDLLQSAFEARDPSKRENAVDLTGVDSDVLDPPPVQQQQQSAERNGESTAEGAPAGRGRGRGWHHALPSWLTSTSAGDLLPRNCETMSDYQLYQQGLLEPPKRGPRFRLRDPTASVVDVTAPVPVPAQFADAGRTSGSGSDRNDPIKLDGAPYFSRGDSRGRGQERRMVSPVPDTTGGHQAAPERPAWDRGNRPERSRSREKDRNRPREHEQLRAQDHRDTFPVSRSRSRSPPRYPEREQLPPPADNPNIMINYASVFTPKPPRPRQCKPLLPEPGAVPDVDFDRSCGHQRKPPREVNSYAQWENQRRQAARDNPVQVPVEGQQQMQRRRSLSPPPVLPRSRRSSVEEDGDVVFLHPSELQGAGRGRNQTLPAWMTAGTSFDRQPPLRAPSPPRFSSRDARSDADRRRDTSPARGLAGTSRGYPSPPRDLPPPRDSRSNVAGGGDNTPSTWAAVSAPPRVRSPPRSSERGRKDSFSAWPDPSTVRSSRSPPREPPPRTERSNAGRREDHRSPVRASSPFRSSARGYSDAESRWAVPHTERGYLPSTRAPSPLPPRDETTGRVQWGGRADGGSYSGQHEPQRFGPRPHDTLPARVAAPSAAPHQAPVGGSSSPPRDVTKGIERGREGSGGTLHSRQPPQREFSPPGGRNWREEDKGERGQPPFRGSSPNRRARGEGRDCEPYLPHFPVGGISSGAGRGRDNVLPAWQTHPQPPPRSPPPPSLPQSELTDAPQARFASSSEVSAAHRGAMEPPQERFAPADSERYPRSHRQRSFSPPARAPPRMDIVRRERSPARQMSLPLGGRRSPPRGSPSRDRGLPQSRFAPAPTLGPLPQFAPPPPLGPPPLSSLKRGRGDDKDTGDGTVSVPDVPDVGSFRTPKRPRVGSELDHPFSSSTPQLSHPPPRAASSSTPAPATVKDSESRRAPDSRAVEGERLAVVTLAPAPLSTPARGGWRSEAAPAAPPSVRVFSIAELQATKRARESDSAPHPVTPTPVPAATQDTLQGDRFNELPPPRRAQARASALGAANPPPPSAPSLTVPTWMRSFLVAAKINTRWVAICERVLVQEQGIVSREMYANLAADYFTDAHLAQLGLTPLAVQLELRGLHTASQASRGEDSGNKEAVVEVVPVDVRSLQSYSTERGRSLVDAGTGTDVDGSGTLCSDASMGTI